MGASANILRIRYTDTDWHEPFYAAVEAIFGCGETFRRWTQLGGWDERYEAYAMHDGPQLVSIVGAMGMHLVLGGVEYEGVQLGAVGTLAEFRRKGLSRQLLGRVLAGYSAAEKPAILFANDTVRDFYPRFGFRTVAQKRFVLPRRLEPTGGAIRLLDLTLPSDRALLAGYCGGSAPISREFAARDYFQAALWTLVHSPRQLVLIRDAAAVVVVSQIAQWLIVHDVYARTVFDLIDALGSVIDAPVEGIEFCFDPGEWLGGRTIRAEANDEDPCYLKWSGALSPGNYRFPDLART